MKVICSLWKLENAGGKKIILPKSHHPEIITVNVLVYFYPVFFLCIYILLQDWDHAVLTHLYPAFFFNMLLAFSHVNKCSSKISGYDIPLYELW